MPQDTSNRDDYLGQIEIPLAPLFAMPNVERGFKLPLTKRTQAEESIWDPVERQWKSARESVGVKLPCCSCASASQRIKGWCASACNGEVVSGSLTVSLSYVPTPGMEDMQELMSAEDYAETYADWGAITKQGKMSKFLERKGLKCLLNRCCGISGWAIAIASIVLAVLLLFGVVVVDNLRVQVTFAFWWLFLFVS